MVSCHETYKNQNKPQVATSDVQNLTFCYEIRIKETDTQQPFGPIPGIFRAKLSDRNQCSLAMGMGTLEISQRTKEHAELGHSTATLQHLLMRAFLTLQILAPGSLLQTQAKSTTSQDPCHR